ncbi:hypothetical protein BGX34_006165 [Mortierella sp. NVP85]|nr:hypothetical protein BGX34_006165 [Mortierella sp. NVP85]
MPLRIWKSKRFSSSVILAFVQMAMFQGVIYFANMVFQEVYQWSAIQTALGFLVHSLLAVVVFTALGRIMPRLHLKPLILVGFLLRCGTALLFSFIDEHKSYWRFAFPAFIIHIFGVGFSMLPIQITAIRDADNKDQGLVGAIYNTGLQLGAPFGLAILNVIAVSANRDALDSGVHSGPILMKGYRNAFYGMIALGLFGFVLTAIILPWDKPQRPAQKPTAEIKDLEAGAPVEANEEKMLDADEEVLRSSSFSSSSKVESDANTITTKIDAADTYKEQNKV